MLKLQAISIILSIILGTILHFTYNLSGCNKIVGLFSSTNESTWEHLKLSFFSILIVAIFEYLIIGSTSNNFVTSKMIATLIAMSCTIILFYTYIGIIGKDNFVIDIGIFILGIIIAQIISYKIMTLPDLNLEILSIIVIIIIAIVFAIFTKNPPKIPLFQDPITKTYGAICKRSKKN